MEFRLPVVLVVLVEAVVGRGSGGWYGEQQNEKGITECAR